MKCLSAHVLENVVDTLTFQECKDLEKKIGERKSKAKKEEVMEIILQRRGEFTEEFESENENHEFFVSGHWYKVDGSKNSIWVQRSRFGMRMFSADEWYQVGGWIPPERLIKFVGFLMVVGYFK